MTEQEKNIVQNSFKKVEPISETVATLFYKKLFESDPSLKVLFKGDIKEQGVKLMSMIKTAVLALHNLESIVTAVENLGGRHVHYGVKKEHYALVGATLIETLRESLGDDFTPEVESAWIKVYTVLSTLMQKAHTENA